MTPDVELVESRRDIALRLYEEALALRDVVGRGMYELALRLCAIRENELWREIDPSLRSFDEFLEQYRFGDWARGKAFALMGQVQAVLALGVAPEEVAGTLAPVGWSKFEVVRPALQSGKVELTEAITDAGTMGRKDLVEKYAHVMHDASPVRSCHDCPALLRGDAARGDRLLAILKGQAPGVPVLDVPWRYCTLRKLVWIDGPNATTAALTFAGCEESPLKKDA